MKAARPEDTGPRSVHACLALLAGAQAVLAFWPTMWLWGWNTLRFVEPLAGWTTWALAGAVLVPVCGRRLTGLVEGYGNRLVARGPLAILTTALAIAVVVSLLPDRVRFVGDSYLRHEIGLGRGSLEFVTGGGPGQFLPLDAFLHFHLPRALAAKSPIMIETFARLLGAIEAMALVLVAGAWARVHRLSGGAAVAVVLGSSLGGALALFTGYSKSTAEMAVLASGIATSSWVLARDGRRAWVPALLLSVALLLHRSAVLLAPVVLWSAVCAVRGGFAAERRTAGNSRNPARVLFPMMAPLVAGAWMLPRVLRTFVAFDRPRHLGTGAETLASAGGADLFALRLFDVANVILYLAPLALVAPIVVALVRNGARSRSAPAPATLWLAFLALPAVVLLLVLHPQQGAFRDWDVFAIPGVLFSMLAAWCVGLVLEGRRAWAWLGAAVALAVGVPTLHSLLVAHDPDRSRARIEAYAIGPPQRTKTECATTWDFLGVQAWEHARWDDAARAFARSVEYAPNLRVIGAWASAEEKRQDWPRAQAAYQLLVEKAPDGPAAWEGLHRTSVRLRDLGETWRAARELARLHPGDLRYARAFATIDSMRNSVR